jgi:putative glutamine amidotransferase
MTPPLIGLTTSRAANTDGYPIITCMESYIQSILMAGGAPVLIPLGIEDVILFNILDRVDGILFTGGGDIHPSRFKGIDHPRISQVDEDRDRVEISIFLDIVKQRKPFLGICRGLQVINTALGGTLYTHIADQHSGAIEHSFYPSYPYTHLSHTVNVKKSSKLGDITGKTELLVNSLHHQGIDRLAEGFSVTALASDGIIEAIEMDGYPYGTAVQWHPEWLLDQAPMLALFRSFIQAAENQNTRAGEVDV